MVPLLAVTVALAGAAFVGSGANAATPHTDDRGAYQASTGYQLPDPQRPGAALAPAVVDEIDTAYALNNSLNLWKVCAWTGQEAAAVIFNTWARTHVVGDEVAAAGSEAVPAWKSFGTISAQRAAYVPETGFNEAPARCDVSKGTRALLKAAMERQAKALAHDHLNARHGR